MLVKLKEVIHPEALDQVCRMLGLSAETLLEPRDSTRNSPHILLPRYEYRVCGTDDKLIIHRDHCGAQLVRRAYFK